ncbi:MAG: RtcB family protein [Myxococcales bacterium]|nr:MAG: RtcB family protein [Myxococcales bacterium]
MARLASHDARCRRLDDVRVAIDNPYDVPVTLFAGREVAIEPGAITELTAFLALRRTLDALTDAQRRGQIAPFWGDDPGRIERVVLTPDFHKGSGIPVGTVVDARGFVLPRAVGNDVCCGMRLLVTDLRRDELVDHLPALEKRLRELFFEGQRDIPMSPRQREALLRRGLPGLVETAGDNAGQGAWCDYDPRQQRDDLARAHLGGGLATRGTFAFDAFIRASGSPSGRDPQIGSIGGGNHFVELQSVEDLLDGPTAHAWGVGRGQVAIMVHTGSVGLGHLVGGHFDDLARGLFPATLPAPSGGFYPLPTTGPLAAHAAAYLDAMGNAANFAFGNRLFLGLMALRALRETLGRPVASRLVHDAPHNLIWAQGDDRFVHRKGATPALGIDPLGGPYAYTGRPVIIPGSMGASSYLLAGSGSDEALCSACHGAGRLVPRGQAAHADDAASRRDLGHLRIVTPIDPQSPRLRGRRDILERHHQRLKEEAPSAYKPIAPVIDSVARAGIARPVARLWPLVTVKG